MTNYLELDKISREKITTDISHNFFVEAGAGSGKTFSLVKRMTAMVLGGIDVRKICAITFTKAAANEFYSRFHKALVEKSNEDLSEIERERVNSAIENIDLCFMGTIDSFCNMILSEHPMAAGIPSSASVISDDEMNALLLKEYSNIAESKCSNEIQEKFKLFKSFNYNAETIYLEGIKFVMDHRNAELVYPKVSEYSLEKLCSGVKNELLLALKTIDENKEYIAIKGGKNPTEFIDNFNDLKNDFYILKKNWDFNITRVISLLSNISNVKLAKNLPDELLDKFSNVISEIRTEKGNLTGYYISLGKDNELYSQIETIKYSVTMDFLNSSSKAISNKLREMGKLTFTDYLLYLRDMLKSDAESDGKLIAHIYNRHSYFLIDEFQDTNPVQAEVFFYITAQNPVGNWRDCVPRPGSLFIVGDPKQSIYRFRNADVASYLSVKNMFKGNVGEVLLLSKNFRSTKQICDWFNEEFEILLPKDTENQSKYANIPNEENDEPSRTFSGVYDYQVSKIGNSFDYKKECEMLCLMINGLVNNPNEKIYNKGKARQIEYKDFMIITPAKTHIKLYVKALNEAGIPTRIEGAVSFSESKALLEMSKVLSALANPNDSVSLYGALKTDIFNLTDDEIEEYIRQNEKLRLYRMGKEAKTKAEKALDKLLSVFIKIENKSAVSALEIIKDELLVFANTGAESLECYYYALELLRSAESSNQITSLKEAAELLSNIAENKTGEERCLSLQKEENRVHIANLHKVKGLEAPIVILADPNSKSKTASSRVADTEDGKKCWLFSVCKDKRPIFSTNLFENEKEDEEDALAAESVRLLYVAATRAKEAIIIASAKNAKGEAVTSNPWYPLLENTSNRKSIEAKDIWSLEQGTELKTVSAKSLIEKAQNDSALSETASLNNTFEIKRPSQIKIKSKTADDDEFKDANSEEIKEQTVTNAALCGTLVHRLLEILVSSKNTVNLENAVKEIILDYSVDDKSMAEKLMKIGTTMRSGGYMQENGQTNDILSVVLSAQEVMCEVPFCYKEENGDKFTLWNGVMDLVYKKDDKWHIVDYKTNAEIDGLSEKYEEQLSAYKSALKMLIGEEADALIYHIDV